MNNVSPDGGSASAEADQASPLPLTQTDQVDPTIAPPSSEYPPPANVEVPHDDPDGMTVLVALNAGSGSPVMAKMWSIVDGELRGKLYDDAFIFTVRTIGVVTFARLMTLLTILKGNFHACVIRGKLLPTANAKRSVRRSRERDGKPPTFAEWVRRWVLLDFDKLLIADFPNPIHDPIGCIKAVIQCLPPQLRSVACFWSFSSSTGVKPDKLGIHLWFLLETPLGWRDVEALIVACGADPAMSRPVQVHYTSAPKFISPMTDPMPNRYGELPGEERISAQAITDLVATGYAMMGSKQHNTVDMKSEQKLRPTRQQPTTTMNKSDHGGSITEPDAVPANEPSPAEANIPTPDGMIGDGHRHRHLMKIAGFGRSRGLDEAGLRALLRSENATHCYPPLETKAVDDMAVSFARYPQGALPAEAWQRSVSLMAGLLRHGASSASAAAAGGNLLENNARAAATVALLQNLEEWERDCAEQQPDLVLSEDGQSAEDQP